MAKENIYAAIDLGSNSFHMLLVRYIAGGVQIIGKIKRRVRLASGLDENNMLSLDAMHRGWECLSLFAERLQDIPESNIRIVGTATLRIAKNVDEFIAGAEKSLNHKIEIISGLEEAKRIYLGVAHTSSGSAKRLVIDIGGASTEVVAGEGFNANILNSFNIGCVTFLGRYFADQKLNQKNFDAAIDAAQQALSPHKQAYLDHQWQYAVGSSGTVQAVAEIQIEQGLDERLTLARLEDIMAQAIACRDLDKLNIPGLLEERKAVFASGLAILIALFRTFSIENMVLGRGALREALIYDMIGVKNVNVRLQTANSLMAQYHVDRQQAQRVKVIAKHLFDQLKDKWSLHEFNADDMIMTAALIHEIGLQVEFKRNRYHAAYILKHVDLPGFSRAQQKLLRAIILNYKQEIDLAELQKQTGTNVALACRLTRILRVAVILAQRRREDVLPDAQIKATGDALKLQLPVAWLASHPLICAELEQETKLQKLAGWTFDVASMP